MTRSCLLALVLLAAGCDTAGPAADNVAPVYEDLPTVVVDDYEAYVAERERLVERLDVLIGEAEATDASACWLLPVGRKACGGPTDYRVYSASQPEADQILQTARQLVALDDFAIEELGVASRCDVPLEPDVVFADGRCQARYGQ